MTQEKTYCKSLSEVANTLGVPYMSLYKHKHRPELTKTSRGYNVKKILEFLNEQERIQEEEEKANSLLTAEDELLEKSIKLEHTRLKCRLLELQILQREGNLVEVNQVIETRAKEITRLRRSLTDMVRKLPAELAEKEESYIRSKITEVVNDIIADLAEFITDDWTSDEELEVIE